MVTRWGWAVTGWLAMAGCHHDDPATPGDASVGVDGGDVVDAPPSGTVELVTNSSLIDLGDVAMGSLVAAGVTIVNGGDATSAPLGFRIDTADLREVSITNACPNHLPPSGVCFALAYCRFLSTGPKTVQVTATAGSADVSVQIVANVGIGQLDTAPANPDLGNVVIGGPGATQTLTVTNSGTLESGLLGMQLDLNEGDWSLGANTCTSSLAPGASCTVDVSFQPTSAGSSRVNLRIDGDLGRSAVAIIRGTGTEVP